MADLRYAGDCANDFWRRSGTLSQCAHGLVPWRRDHALSDRALHRHGQIAKACVEVSGGFEAAAGKFYYDTAQVANPPAMSALTKVIPLSQILFGTDYPARPFADHVKGLKECGILGAKH